MANIKVSELPTAITFNDDDYTMIVQNNTTKKISKENMYGNYIFSTNETVVGKWIDGKPIYRKVIDTGSMNFSDSKNVEHNISNIDKITNIKCIGYGIEGIDMFINIPHIFKNYAETLSILEIMVSNQYIFFIYKGSEILNYIDNSFTILEYTKTTD